MAVWEFSFYIVSEEKRNDADINEIISWENVALNSESVVLLEKAFPKVVSWSESLYQYGEKDRTHIEFFYGNMFLCEISCIINIKNVIREELVHILKFIKANNALIYYNGLFFNPDIKTLLELIKKSDAFRFCENPRSFFDEK